MLSVRMMLGTHQATAGSCLHRWGLMISSRMHAQGYYRRADASLSMGRMKKALADFKRAAQVLCCQHSRPSRTHACQVGSEAPYVGLCPCQRGAHGSSLFIACIGRAILILNIISRCCQDACQSLECAISTQVAPRDPDLRRKLEQCEREVKRIRFEEALAMPVGCLC